MGNAESMDAQLTDFRARNKPPKLPMPDPAELEERFAIALVKKIPFSQYPLFCTHCPQHVNLLIVMALVLSYGLPTLTVAHIHCVAESQLALMMFAAV